MDLINIWLCCKSISHNKRETAVTKFILLGDFTGSRAHERIGALTHYPREVQ